MTTSHDELVRTQFGPTANAYVASAVHAAGTDLELIAERVLTMKPKRALDLGAGGGHVAYALAGGAEEVVASDLSPDMLTAVTLEAARRGIDNIRVELAAAEALPFPDARFDFLACRFSTHHWRDAEAGLREARRVLAPGAPAIFVDIVAPRAAELDTHLQTVELLRDGSHVRDYTIDEWVAMFARAHFAVRGIIRSRLRMGFTDWIARMRTPPVHVAAIRALQEQASAEIARHYAIEPDGSFTIDMALFEVE